mmetsp:Transcript_23130/g.37082  ORF Transcript_23130/g.37082 Transcript_23130/m.37082 type:complete len:201 (-) Transcript_23130:187-789(-)|eukprot:CAMPEP_0179429632 /NCGR_PEP_ID=MMETSP0799-20121207/14957_1 /TAXON_ID=46947 /ORGANISM="Geminigera cryophila, Strain CCMP2564" /LENGTH=200 /DNA_ID=CAMNT_0021205627 /DNA_START=104 /DNA_END=706 /DNA_ORIENTATION=+
MCTHVFMHEQMSPAARAQSARTCFEELPLHVLAGRGRIMLEPLAPFYITSCSGMAAKLLHTSSLKLAGRRLQAIAQAAEIAKLKHATCTVLELPNQRAYLSLATETGHMHVAIQKCETAGRLQIEVLFFPAEPGSWLQDVVFDTIQSQAVVQGTSGAHSPDKDLEMSPVEGDDDEAIAGVASTEITDKHVNLKPATSSAV